MIKTNLNGCELLEILQDQGFITVVGIIIGVIVTTIIYRLQKKRKSIGFRVLSKTSLLSVKEEIAKDIEILYKGNPIKHVQLIIIRFVCLGNIPIEYEDYEAPISINFGETSQIFSAEILEKKPDDLGINLGIEDNKVVFQECLLNQGDTIIIKVLASKTEEELNVQGRISGIKRIVELPEQSRLFMALFFVIIGVFSISSIAWVYSWLFLPRPEVSTIMNMTMIIIMPFALVFTVLTFIDTRKNKNIQKKLKKLLDQTNEITKF